MALTPINSGTIEAVLARLVPDYKARGWKYSRETIDADVRRQYHELYASKATNLSADERESLKSTRIDDRAYREIFREPFKDGKGIFLSGPRGSGKTRLMKEFMNEYAQFPTRLFRYFHFDEIMNKVRDEIKARAGDASLSVATQLGRLYGVVIDDFTMPRSISPREIDKLEEILRIRHRNNTFTYILSRLNENDVLSKLDSEFLDILTETMRFVYL
jgi:Predicted ATPase